MKIESAYQLASANGVKALVYGGAGSGKTYLISTAPAPLILSAESGLLTFKKLIKETGVDYPVIVINSMADLTEAYNWVAQGQDQFQFQTICLDSISEISEVLLKEELMKNKDPRKAYGEVATQMSDVLRKFRDLPGRNVYFSAKETNQKDDTTGLVTVMPLMPGRQLGGQIPYFFDEVFYLYVYKDAEGRSQRALRTQPDLNTIAKDRSGLLDVVEHANLTNIFGKILQP